MTRVVVDGKTMPSLLSAVRERVHPLHQMRRVRPLRAVLAWIDVPFWMRVHGVRWRIRGRFVRDAAYRVLRSAPEPHARALVEAVFELFHPRTFWDVGAHFGYYGFLVKSLDPTVSVVFCEPAPGNAQLISESLSRVPVEGLTLLQAAISDLTGTAPFVTDLISGATGSLTAAESAVHRAWGASRTVEVRTTTLDVAVGDTPLDMLKIDVEGHEEAVVRGGLRIFERCRPLVVFECFHGGEELRSMLEPLGYEFFDVERLTAPTSATSNFFALPPRHQGARDALLLRWRERLEER